MSSPQAAPSHLILTRIKMPAATSWHAHERDACPPTDPQPSALPTSEERAPRAGRARQKSVLIPLILSRVTRDNQIEVVVVTRDA